MAAVLVLVVAGLVVADALHKRSCHESHKGEVIQFRGERIGFLNTGQETNGEALEMDILYKPSAGDNESHWRDVHVHRDQEEHFEVISGTARFYMAGREQTLTAGQRITVPRSVPHSFASGTGEELHLHAEFRPALRTDAAASNFMRARKTHGNLSLLQAAVIIREFEGIPYPPGLRGYGLQTMFKVLAPIGRVAGYQGCGFEQKTAPPE